VKRKRRMVRLHMKGSEPSVEGFFVGFWANHYVVELAKVLVGEDNTESLDGPDLVVPRENVVFMQRLR
jgi:hypothetical protein